MKFNVAVTFSGVVEVETPDGLDKNDAIILAEKIALARILATTDNPDAPEEQSLEDYENECSQKAALNAENDWDKTTVEGVSGCWASSDVGQVLG